MRCFIVSSLSDLWETPSIYLVINLDISEPQFPPFESVAEIPHTHSLTYSCWWLLGYTSAPYFLDFSCAVCWVVIAWGCGEGFRAALWQRPLQAHSCPVSPAGEYEKGVDHLTNAVAVCGQPQQLLQVLQQTLPPPVFQMLLTKLPTIGQVKTPAAAWLGRIWAEWAWWRGTPLRMMEKCWRWQCLTDGKHPNSGASNLVIVPRKMIGSVSLVLNLTPGCSDPQIEIMPSCFLSLAFCHLFCETARLSGKGQRSQDGIA